MGTWRFINPDGTMNVERSSLATRTWTDLYHLFLTLRWRSMFLLVTTLYLALNMTFGTAYFLAGPGALNGLKAQGGFDRWLECVFFSVQTLATIGYGGISPSSLFAHLLVTIEALVGLVGLALVTGIVFSRFSRPTARVRFSRQALITRIDGKPCLVFRMSNERLNQIVEAQVRVVLARSEKTPEGLTFRELYDLSLERERSPLFAMTWTVVHWITPESPLHLETFETLRSSELEIIATLVGTDETFSQTVHSRFSYTAEDLAWNRQFQDMIFRTDEGKLHVALEKISETRGCECEPVADRIH